MRSVSSKYLVSARLHLEQHLLDRAHPQLEPAGEVGAILRQLALDVVERRGVVREERQAFLGHAEIPARQDVADAERARQLQPEAALLVERVMEEALQRLEPAGGPQRRLALLGAACQPRADREDRRPRAEHALGRVAHERQHLLELARPLEDVDLVEDHHDLLAPGPDRLDERALRLGERPVR